MMGAALEIAELQRRFVQGERQIEVLKGAALTLQPGEVVGLLGPSGSGKSTLLQLAGLLERGDEDRVVVNGTECRDLGDNERTRLRRDHLGFVYQFHNLLPEFTALENVMLPLSIAGESKAAATEKAEDLLTSVGLAERLDHRPSELSGGEQQRVAIARALANDPSVLLADEPTGNLDEATAERVMAVLLERVHENKVAALIATHNVELAATMDRTVTLRDGLLVSA